MSDTWWVSANQLDEFQAEVITLPINQSYLIVGPPGSGKTNLLLLKANYFHLSDKQNILLLTFNRTLREFVVSGGHHYDFKPDRIKTSVGMMAEILSKCGKPTPEKGTFPEVRQKLITQCRDLLDTGSKLPKYEALLIDEAQDFRPEEVELFTQFAEVLFVVADDKQQIYSGTASIKPWENAIPKKNWRVLKYHYRNGETICRLADGIKKPQPGAPSLVETCQYDEDANPSSVTILSGSTLLEQLALAQIQIENQLKAFPDQMIGVICPVKSSLEKIIEYFRESEIANECIFQTIDGEGYMPFVEDKHVCISTIHSAKGLEFRAVHLLDAQKIQKFPENRENIAFTAVTRAKTSLTVYFSSNLPQFFTDALSQFKAKEPPKLEDLFRRKN